MMAGGAVAGALIASLRRDLKAPHGGIFVFFAIGKLAWFLRLWRPVPSSPHSR